MAHQGPSLDTLRWADKRLAIGAPVGRFVRRLHELLSNADGVPHE